MPSGFSLLLPHSRTGVPTEPADVLGGCLVATVLPWAGSVFGAGLVAAEGSSSAQAAGERHGRMLGRSPPAEIRRFFESSCSLTF